MADWARVVTAMGNHGLAQAEAEDGDAGAAPFEIRFRRAVGRPLPGDRVEIGAHGEVVAILPRHSLFGRGLRGRFRPMAANIDRLLIVIAPEPSPSRALLHRYVAAARIQGIEPAIVLNKADLPVPGEPPFDEIEALGIPVFRTRAAPPAELGALPRSLQRGLHLLAGQSGVGKTSLANALIPDLAGQTAMLSQATGKGRHTTTSARLLRLPESGWLVDTPGVWEYELWQMPPDELARGFPELSAIGAGCRFRDCRHDSEPGCAVRAAVDAGTLPSSRLEAWRALCDEQRRLAG